MDEEAVDFSSLPLEEEDVEFLGLSRPLEGEPEGEDVFLVVDEDLEEDDRLEAESSFDGSSFGGKVFFGEVFLGDPFISARSLLESKVCLVPLKFVPTTASDRPPAPELVISGLV